MEVHHGEHHASEAPGGWLADDEKETALRWGAAGVASAGPRGARLALQSGPAVRCWGGGGGRPGAGAGEGGSGVGEGAGGRQGAEDDADGDLRGVPAAGHVHSGSALGGGRRRMLGGGHRLTSRTAHARETGEARRGLGCFCVCSVGEPEFWCIYKEADLTCALLRLDADPIHDDIIRQGTTIRMFAFSLMNCPQDNSVSASAVMLGMVKEAEIMCSWIHINKVPIDVYVEPPSRRIEDSHDIRCWMLNFMADILKVSLAAEHEFVMEEPAAEHKTVKEEPARSCPGADGDYIAADDAANTSGGSQSKKGGKKSNKRERKEEDLFGKILSLERLVMLLDSSVKVSDYMSYLEKYYENNASGFIAAAAKKPKNASITDMGLAVAKICLKMEEELVSVWNTQVLCYYSIDPLAFNTIMESFLIKDHVLLVCRTGVEWNLPSVIAFACITKEAELMCELLKQGARPSFQCIQLSSVIRICALGLVKGHQSFASAPAMMGMASEAKEMLDWMKNRLCLPEGRELEDSHLFRNNAFVVMTDILSNEKNGAAAQSGNEPMDVDKLAAGEDEPQTVKKKNRKKGPQDEEMATEPLIDDEQDETPKKKKSKKRKANTWSDSEPIDVDKLVAEEDEPQSEKKKKHKREKPQDDEVAKQDDTQKKDKCEEPQDEEVAKQGETPKKKKNKKKKHHKPEEPQGATH